MPDLWLIVVVTTFAFATLGRLFAEKTGRNKTLWTLAGVFFNVGLLAAIFCVEQRRSARTDN